MATATARRNTGREIEGRDSVGLYLDEIARTPLLDAAREVELAKAGQTLPVLDRQIKQGLDGATGEFEEQFESSRAQLEQLSRYDLKAVFFVDPMPALVYGIEPIQAMMSPILAAGHRLHDVHDVSIRQLMAPPLAARDDGIVDGHDDRGGRNVPFLEQRLDSEGFVVERTEDRYAVHYSVRPFRHTEDAWRHHLSKLGSAQD